MPVVVKDNGYKLLLKRVEEMAGGLAVEVGVHSDAGGDAVEKAVNNEFGINGVERSFLRGWVDQDEGELERDLIGPAESILRGTAPEVAIAGLGEGLAEKSRAFIQSGRVRPPSNSEVTLVDTGEMVGSIDWKPE